MKSITLSIIGFITGVALVWFFFIGNFSLREEKPNESNNLGNMFSQMATSSTIAVGPQENKTLFTARQTCSSRVITTVAQPIMLSFNTNITATALAGHLQSASTTIVYKSDDFGCGAVSAYGHNASTTITTSEFTL